MKGRGFNIDLEHRGMDTKLKAYVSELLMEDLINSRPPAPPSYIFAPTNYVETLNNNGLTNPMVPQPQHSTLTIHYGTPTTKINIDFLN
mgnify:CR=1 FL=1